MDMKKLLRTLLVLMLALSLVLSFASCGDEETDDPGKEPGGFEDIIPGLGEGVEGPIIPYE